MFTAKQTNDNGDWNKGKSFFFPLKEIADEAGDFCKNIPNNDDASKLNCNFFSLFCWE